MLLDNGGDVNRPLNATFSRATPLMIAAQNGDLEMAKLLVSRKAKIEMLGEFLVHFYILFHLVYSFTG